MARRKKSQIQLSIGHAIDVLPKDFWKFQDNASKKVVGPTTWVAEASGLTDETFPGRSKSVDQWWVTPSGFSVGVCTRSGKYVSGRYRAQEDMPDCIAVAMSNLANSQ